MKKNTTVDIKLVLIIIAVAIVVFIGGIFWVQGFQNKAIRLEEKVESSASNIKVQEKKRVDLVQNLVDCVKDYNEYEASTLTAVVSERSTDEQIEEAKNAIVAVAEQYPELKASDNYQTLMNNLSAIENQLASYREAYNDGVENYNRYVKSFPARVMLNWTGYEKQSYERLNFDTSEDAPNNLFED